MMQWCEEPSAAQLGAVAMCHRSTRFHPRRHKANNLYQNTLHRAVITWTRRELFYVDEGADQSGEEEYTDGDFERR